MPVIHSWGRALVFGTPHTAMAAAFLQSIAEHAAEQRFQLDFRINDAALARMLPAGREVAMPPRRGPRTASYRAGGGKIAALFVGTEKRRAGIRFRGTSAR